MNPPMPRDEAVYRALLFLLQWSDDEARKLGPLAPQAFMKALQQDGYMVISEHDHERCYEREVYEEARDAYQTTIRDLQHALNSAPVSWPPLTEKQ